MVTELARWTLITPGLDPPVHLQRGKTRRRDSDHMATLSSAAREISRVRMGRITVTMHVSSKTRLHQCSPSLFGPCSVLGISTR
ncbi:hypothetical protein VTK73DRAFT_4622 [Phialemonium thermophilum]|uniref:Uncharacterized protein n=1 Tax=Phialemonium thermophilum TaxID=223376 RepID=A0ABR3V7A7_9PEZI